VFDAGAIESSLTVDTSKFDRALADAEAKVKRFESERHEVKIAAVFDQSSISRARQQFAQLDNQISKDAMSRLRSSPQGSVLGALNALFSPHPVTGAPSAQQAATQGLPGKMISAPGGGGPASGGSGSTVRTVLNQAAAAASPAGTGNAPGNVTTSDNIKRMITGAAPGDVTTTDTIKQAVTGKGPGDVTTTDTVREKLDPASAAKTEADSKASGDRSGGGWLSSFTGHIKNLLPSSATSTAEKAAGDSGNRSGAAMGKGLLSGIGPGIGGISGKVSAIAGAVAVGLGALPAVAGVAGVGTGVALIGGIVGIVSKGAVTAVQPAVQAFQALQAAAPGPKQVAALAAYQNALAQLTPAQQSLAKSLEGAQAAWQNFVKSNTAGVSAIIGGGIGLLPGILKSMSGVFQAVVPQMSSVFQSLNGVVQGLIGVAKTAVPAFAPFINAVLGLVTNILPGIDVVIKATLPYISQFAGILGSLGKNLGGLFAAAAPAIGASMKILGSLLGLVGGLLPVIVKLGDVFATALAPVFSTFAGVITRLLPPLVQLGGVLASFAGAVIGDLAGALSAVATLIGALAPSLTVLGTTLSSVFTIMENAGVFAVLGSSLENLAAPVAGLVNALVTGLAPVLPVLITAFSQLVTAGTVALSVSLGALLTALTPVVAALAQVVVAVTGFLQSAGLLLPVMAGLMLTVGPLASGLKAMAAGAALFAESGMAGAVGGMIGSLKEFALATEGVTLAEKAQYAEMLLMDAISPFGWAVIAGVTLAAVVIGLNQLQSGIGATVAALAKQDDAVGFNIAGYQKLAAQTQALGEQQSKTAEGIGTSAAKGAGVVRGVVAANGAAFTAASTQLTTLAANMGSRLTALSGTFGVSQAQIEKWAGAAGISAAKFAGAGENVGLLTTQIGAFVDKNALAITSTASLSTNIAIFGGDVFSATTQLDAFNAIWNTLVGNLLTKQQAVTQGQTSFDNLKTSIAQGGTASDQSKQSFEQYIQQIQSSLDALQKGGASVSDLNGYLQTQIGNLESLHNLTPGEQQDLANLKTLQDDLANSVHGLNSAQQALITQFEASLIPDLQQMAADTPTVKTDISNLADAIIQTGNNSAATAGDRAQLIADLKQAGLTSQEAAAFVKTLQGQIDALKGKVVTVGVTATAQGTLNAISHLAGQNPSTSILTLSTAANGMLVSGGTPGKDSVLAMLMPGEVVVPTAMVAGGAVDHLRGQIPGFATGGMVNLDGPGSWAASNEGTWGTAVATAWAQASKAAFDTAAAAAAAQAAAAVQGIAAGAIEAAFVSMAAARGWTGSQLTALLQVEQREAGFNMTAQNPTSSAYGLAQFINGPGEYAQWGGNSTTATGQITAMLNYIAAVYGTPQGAWNHELSYGWYDRGGSLNPGYTLAYNGTGRAEHVVSGASITDLASRLDQLHADMREMVNATRAVPAGVGAHVGGALNGAAADASFRSRYPRS